MATIEQVLIKYWQIIKKASSSKSEKCGALTYFRSSPGIFALEQMLKPLQAMEVCLVALDLTSSDDKELSLEARQTFICLIADETDVPLSLYKVGQHLPRDKRLKFFTFLESLDINLLVKFSDNDTTIKFVNDCMQNVNSKKMEWLSPLSCTENINLLTEAEQKYSTNTDDIEYQLVFKSIQLLQRLYANALTSTKNYVTKYHVFLFDKIILLAYMGFAQQRKLALELLSTALKTNLVAYMQVSSPKLWLIYKDDLSKMYCPRMDLLIKSKEYDWATQWSLSVQILGIDLHRGGAGLINPLLGIEEKAFKSSDNRIRKQAFLCWKILMDNFALNPTELSSNRRIKLLCIPLTAKNSKIESLALVKLETWWHLIIKLDPKSAEFLQQVLNGFLEFCFGPLGDTPLLSTQIDSSGIIASPGKRFHKTRVLAVDALLQLLVRRKKDRELITLSLKERLPDAITNVVFKSIYKRLFHSVGEALLLITNLTDDDLKNRDKLCNILWSNLVEYIEESNDDERIPMFKELIIVISEITNHINDSIIMSNLIINTIIPELADLPHNQFTCNDDTLITLAKKLLNPSVLKKIELRHLDSIKTIIHRGLKTLSTHTKILEFIDSVISAIEIDCHDNFYSIIIEVWRIFAGILIKYINDDNNINQGNDTNHNFSTIFKIIHFPFTCSFWRDITPAPQQAKMIISLWIKLYKLFDMKAHAILTVKPNEILDTLTNTINKYCLKEKKCYRFVAYCLETIISTIDYKVLFTNNQVPSMIHILRDTTRETLMGPEGELSLKALSLVLMSTYSLADYNKTLDYLEAVKSTIEYMLKIEVRDDNIEKEIINTWDTVVIIIKGHAKYLTSYFIAVYHDTFLAAYCHKSVEIVANIMSLNESIDLKQDVKKALLDIVKEAEAIFLNQNLITDNKKKQMINDPRKLQKPIKIVGSYIGRERVGNTKSPTTVTKLVSMKKDNNEFKKIVSNIPIDNESQDYVVINNAINVDVNCLTEHQKENFKRRRDDIPALYNDLSQSQSHDTQDLKEWFNEKRKKATENDDNDNNNKKQKTSFIDKQNESSPMDEETIVKSIDSTAIKENTSDNLSDSIAKKLDFESRDEYPNDNEHIDDKQNEMVSKKRDKLLTRGRGRGRSIKPREPTDTDNKNLKRKASSDNESDNPIDNKKRKRSSPDTSLNSETYVTSDSDSNSSNESENQSSGSQETTKSGKKNLPEQTKRELLRLRINMVSDSYLPGRRRSKLTDEIDNKQNKIRKDEESQELTKYRRKKNSKIQSDNIKTEETSPSGKRKKSNNDNDKLNSSFDDASDKSSSLDPNEEQQEQIGELINNEKISTVNKPDTSDHEEVVESSQDTLPTRSPKRIEKRLSRLNSPSSRSSNVPVTSTPIVSKTIPLINENNQSTSNLIPKKSPEKLKQPTTAITTSPKSSKIFIKKRPTLPPPSQRRTTQIMDMLKGMNNDANNDDKPSDEFTNVAEFVANKKTNNNELNFGSPVAKKDRHVNLNTPDKINSPSGSRQEKIFNNMKISEIKNTGSSILFSNLKNNGEKISPKLERTYKINDNEYKDKGIDDNTSMQNNELEILEWSSANPPSLTASPSVSILKRQVSLIESSSSTTTDNDTSFNGKKRVSFADPPVSKQMGYRVLSSPLRAFPVTRRFVVLGKNDTPFQIKPLKLRNKIQIDNNNSCKIDENTTIDTTDLSPIENVTDMEISSENEYLTKIGNELEDAANMDLESDSDESPDDSPSTNDKLDTGSKSQNILLSKNNNTDNSMDNLDNQQNTKQKTKDTLASSFDLNCHDSLTGKFKQSMDLFDPNYDLTNKNKINKTVLKTSTPSTLLKSSISNSSVLDAADDIAVGKMLHERALKKGLQQSSSPSPSPSSSTTSDDNIEIQNVKRSNSTTETTVPIIPITKKITVVTTIPATPVTDKSSINESLKLSPINISQSQDKSTGKTNPIYSNLINCQEPISKITDEFPPTLWRSRFIKYLTYKKIIKVGDLAKRPENEILNISIIQGQNTVDYVKRTLDEYYKKNTTKNNKLQTKEITQSPAEKEGIIEDVESTIEPITQEKIDSSCDISTPNTTIDNSMSNKNSQKHVDSQLSDEYGSMIIDSSIETPKRVVTDISELLKLPKIKVIDTVSPTSQSKQNSSQPLIFKELDLDVIVQHVVKKCSIEQIFGHLKSKMNNMTKEEKLNEIMKIFNINIADDEKFKVLIEIQKLFSTEKNFITEVLTTYKKQVTSDICLQTINANILKEAICKSCTSSELLKLLTTVLNNEKKNGIRVPVDKDLTIEPIIDKLSIDSITKTIDNNNQMDPSTVADKIQKNSPNVAIKLFNNMVKPETIDDTLTKSNMSEDELLAIFKSISKKLSTDTLLAGFTDVVKQKMK
ncbi:telomere-associated protein RIF1 [Aphidius gifuensis]|uniref:telomere-associated protein RIF1 n=1 Tax=Aphidius gifuensis TaxID=684658 RepID=UPI001CDBD573|nr:telomere-associated protein RIF1 [Aphidius gifuensis]